MFTVLCWQCLPASHSIPAPARYINALPSENNGTGGVTGSSMFTVLNTHTRQSYMALAETHKMLPLDCKTQVYEPRKSVTSQNRKLGLTQSPPSKFGGSSLCLPQGDLFFHTQFISCKRRSPCNCHAKKFQCFKISFKCFNDCNYLNAIITL